MIIYWPIYSFFVVLLIYINVEYQIVLLPCESADFAIITNRIISTLCSSYVAADIFYIFVTFYPEIKRKRKMRPYIKRKLWEISEALRLCRDCVIPLFSNMQELTEENFVEMFDNQDLLASTPLTFEKTVLKKIQDKVKEINSIIDNLLLVQDFLSNEELNFINELSTSLLLTSEIYPNNEIIDESIKNQRNIGKCIYKLYNKSRTI